MDHQNKPLCKMMIKHTKQVIISFIPMSLLCELKRLKNGLRSKACTIYMYVHMCVCMYSGTLFWSGHYWVRLKCLELVHTGFLNTGVDVKYSSHNSQTTYVYTVPDLYNRRQPHCIYTVEPLYKDTLN